MGRQLKGDASYMYASLLFVQPSRVRPLMVKRTVKRSYSARFEYRAA